MTTPPERYADLLPDHIETAIQRTVGRRSGATPPPDLAHPSAGILSRKGALKAGMVAAGAAWLLALGHTGAAIASEVADLAQEGPMTAARLGAILRAKRRRWHALLDAVGPARMDVPGVDGSWSIKQIVAHLTWYEGVIVEGAQQLLQTGTFVREGLRALSMDERNAILADQSLARPAPAILAESERVFGQLLAVIAACPDDLLNDPRRLGLPDDVVPWMLVANNSYTHYREHAQAIRAWLATQPASPDGDDGEPGGAPAATGRMG